MPLIAAELWKILYCSGFFFRFFTSINLLVWNLNWRFWSVTLSDVPAWKWETKRSLVSGLESKITWKTLRPSLPAFGFKISQLSSKNCLSAIVKLITSWVFCSVSSSSVKGFSSSFESEEFGGVKLISVRSERERRCWEGKANRFPVAKIRSESNELSIFGAAAQLVISRRVKMFNWLFSSYMSPPTNQRGLIVCDLIDSHARLCVSWEG